MDKSESEYELMLLKTEQKLDETNRAKIFGQRLCDAIKASGMKPREVEKATLIDATTMYRYMKGQVSPKAYNVYKLSKVLKSSFGDLYPL